MIVIDDHVNLMIRRWGKWAILAATVVGVGCTPTASQQRADDMWDMNFLARQGRIGELKPIDPVFRTSPVPNRAGVAAIYANPQNPEKSIVIGTDASRKGGLYVFDLQGEVLQEIPGIRLPYGAQTISHFDFGRRKLNIFVTIERDTARLRVFGINPEKQRLWEISGETAVLTEEAGTDAGPIGLVTFQNSGGKSFVAVSRKSNDNGLGILYLYELTATEGRVNVKFIRDFGIYSKRGLVDAIVADAENNAVFYFDPGAGIRKHPLFLGDKERARDRALFGQDGWEVGCAALAIREGDRPGTGHLLGADRQENMTTLLFYRREGETDNPNRHDPQVQRAALDTRLVGGMAISSSSLPKFPEGIVVLSNQATMTFDFYSWRDVRTQYASALQGR